MLKMDKMGLTLYDRVVIPILIEKITKKAWQSLFLWYNIDTLFKRVVVRLDLTPKGLFLCRWNRTIVWSKGRGWSSRLCY